MVITQLDTLCHWPMYMCMHLQSTHIHAIRLKHKLHYYVHILHMSITLHLPPFDVKAPSYISTAYNRTPFELTTYDHMWFISDCLTDAVYSVVIWIFIMDLVIYNADIIHYNMDPLWSVALGQSYFTHPDYLIIHCCIQATLLHPTLITPVGVLKVCRYLQIFEGVVGYMPNGAPYYHIISIFYSLIPHVTTTFPLP